MASIRVSTQVIRGVANEVEGLASQYQTQATNLFNEGRELDTTWDGDANQSFNTQCGRDEPLFNQLKTVFDQYVQALRSFADTYDRSEAEAVQEQQTRTFRRT